MGREYNTFLFGVLIMDYGFASRLLAKKCLERVFHTIINPPLESFAEHTMWTSQEEVLKNLPTVFDSATNIGHLMDEYDQLNQVLERRYREITLTYPMRFAIENTTSFFIYALVRSIRPNVILETGVANGHSTYFILNALANNKAGKLHSIDVNAKAGALIQEDERDRWDLSIMPGFLTRKRDFKGAIDRIGTIDVFFHDSNHFYYWQNFEYNSVLPKIRQGGYLLSDDVDYSYAFLDLSKKQSLEPTFITDYRKFFGFVRV